MVKMKKIFLSYCLSSDTPSFGNSDPLKIEKTKDMSCGDSCNQLRLTLSNHIGTHIDCPSHFDQNGKTIDQYQAEEWFFQKPFLLEINAKPGDLIQVENYAERIPKDTDFLIVKTGFCHQRSEKVYWENNPGLAPSSGSFLRQNFPRLRAIGFDLLSLTAYQHRAEGRKAHHEFLHAKNSGQPIMIVEDMDLTTLDKSPAEIMVIPLRGKSFDGAPVTVIAQL